MTRRRSDLLVVGALFALGALVRAKLAFTGGIWADEGLVVNIVAIPSWSEMIDFLRFHESHPPLFYAITRIWTSVTGYTDASALVLMVLIGGGIVPVTYGVAWTLFSRKVALTAAILVAISPSLAEHSAQIRPYGLLPLLVLLSCHFLILGLHSGLRRHWAAYILGTSLLLYTHNWTWLVLGGEVVAASYVIVKSEPPAQMRMLRGLLIGIAGVGLVCLPWLPSLVYQVVHAGHTAPPVYNAVDRIGFAVFGALSSPYLLLLGTYPATFFSLTLIACGAAVTVAALFRTFGRQRKLSGLEEPTISREPALTTAALRVMLLVPTAALGAALIMSPRSNLLLERCVVMLTPLLLIAIAAAILRIHESERGRLVGNSISIFVFTFVVALSIANLMVLLGTTRSNAREVAAVVIDNMQPDDLMILAPEWYGPSFNHYFPASLEQFDYPQSGRSGLLDFADLRTRSRDTTALVSMRQRIAAARDSGRRVWLISSRKYIDYVDDQLSRPMTEEQRNRYTSVLRVKEARDELLMRNGPADTVYFARGKFSRYEEILPMLFVPPSYRQVLRP